MSKIKTMTLKAKLMFCVGFLSVVTLIVGLIGMYSSEQVADKGEKIYSDGLMPCLHLTGIEQSLTDIHTYYLHVAYGGQPADLNKLQSKISEEEALIKAYANYDLDAESMALYEILKDSFTSYNNAVYNHIKNIGTTTSMASVEEMNQVISYADKVQIALNNLNEKARDNAEGKKKENEHLAILAKESLFGMMLVGIVISLVIVYGIIKSVSKQIGNLVQAVERVAQGKLDVEIEVNSKDEIGNIFNSINHSKESLKNIISSVKENSNTINNEIEGLLDTYKNINYLRI